MTTFFSHSPQISNFHHYFPVSIHFFIPFRISEKFSFPPTFAKMSPLFRKIDLFLYTLLVFRFPYFYHDAFMQLTMHVLDAPAN